MKVKDETIDRIVDTIYVEIAKELNPQGNPVHWDIKDLKDKVTKLLAEIQND